VPAVLEICAKAWTLPAVKTTRGILQPQLGLSQFELSRQHPDQDLLPFVEAIWTVRWDRRDKPPFQQEVLPFPCVNLAFEEGKYNVHGPGTQRFVATLTGVGWVTGVRFKPAGFFAFARQPMHTFVDCVTPAETALGRAQPSVPSGPQDAPNALMKYLRECSPQNTATLELVNQLVETAQSDRHILRAEDLAHVAGVSIRSLHRLLERHVGVSSKWIVRRARVHDAAELVARGERVDWARVAQELGYHDQAHLIHDFRQQIGFTPERYARRCASLNEPGNSR